MAGRRTDRRFLNIDRAAGQVLRLIAERLACLIEVDPNQLPFGRKVSRLIGAEVEDARANHVALDWPSLLGHRPDRAEGARLRRAIGRLERAGLIEIQRRGPVESRMTHVKLIDETE